MPVENLVDLATDYTNFQSSEVPQELGWNNLEMVYLIRFVKGDDNWMSPANRYNLGNDGSYSGVFAILAME